MKKKLIAAILSVLMMLSLCVSSLAASGTWKHDGSGWWYAYDNGGYACGKWENVDGKWYHFNSRGYMQTGWINDGGTWYWLDRTGAMVTGWKKIDGVWYRFDGNGCMQTGWVKDGGIWYYLDRTGSMVTGWQQIDGAWYYFDENGRLMTYSHIDQKYFLEINGPWNDFPTDSVTTGSVPAAGAAFASEATSASDASSSASEATRASEVHARNEIKLTFHQDGWYVARMEVQLREKATEKYVWFYSDSRAKGQKTTVTIDADKYEINRVGYQIWFFGWDNDYMNLPWANTDHATDFTLSGSGDYPEFTWKN